MFLKTWFWMEHIAYYHYLLVLWYSKAKSNIFFFFSDKLLATLAHMRDKKYMQWSMHNSMSILIDIINTRSKAISGTTYTSFQNFYVLMNKIKMLEQFKWFITANKLGAKQSIYQKFRLIPYHKVFIQFSWHCSCLQFQLNLTTKWGVKNINL